MLDLDYIVIICIAKKVDLFLILVVLLCFYWAPFRPFLVVLLNDERVLVIMDAKRKNMVPLPGESELLCK